MRAARGRKYIVSGIQTAVEWIGKSDSPPYQIPNAIAALLIGVFPSRSTISLIFENMWVIDTANFHSSSYNCGFRLSPPRILYVLERKPDSMEIT